MNNMGTPLGECLGFTLMGVNDAFVGLELASNDCQPSNYNESHNAFNPASLQWPDVATIDQSLSEQTVPEQIDEHGSLHVDAGVSVDLAAADGQLGPTFREMVHGEQMIAAVEHRRPQPKRGAARRFNRAAKSTASKAGKKITSGKGTAKAVGRQRHNGILVPVYDAALVAQAVEDALRIIGEKRIKAFDFRAMEEIFTTETLKSAIVWSGRPGDATPSYGNRMFQAFKKAVADRLEHGKLSWAFETGSNGMGFRRKILSRGYAAGTKGRVKSNMAALEAAVKLLAAKNSSLTAEITFLRAELLARPV